MNQKFPSKRLGQNYLVDENIVKKIISEIEVDFDDIIMEIGPGRGALTSKLIGKTKKLIAIELDKRNVQLLSDKFPKSELISGDILKINLEEIYNKYKQKIRIIGNIPYNISSPIIFKMIENRQIIRDSVLTVQYEVAQRIIAKPGSREYGILSVITQNFAKVKLCFKVSPNVFYPRPKVYSAVIHLFFNLKKNDRIIDKIFIDVVKAAFGNRRKMLCNSFKNSIFAQLNFEETGIDLKLRAENLSVEDFNILSKFAAEQMDKVYSKSNKYYSRV
jgi:16S rRNA (adenine1518-N6/adenine1519-N6)-dimethyltransferase